MNKKEEIYCYFCDKKQSEHFFEFTLELSDDGTLEPCCSDCANERE